MSVRKFNRFVSQPKTLDELIVICKAMKTMDRKRSFEFGKENGISKHNVDAIRQMLGYSNNDLSKHLTSEQRDQIADEYKEGGQSFASLARKYGVNPNSVRCILVARGVDTTNPIKWRKRDEYNLLNLIKKGMSCRKIAAAMGKSRNSIQGKIKRMVRDGIIKEEDIKNETH